MWALVLILPGIMVSYTIFAAIYGIFADTRPKRLVGAALQAYITELEYDTEIVERPKRTAMNHLEDVSARLARAKTRADLDAIYREFDVNPQIWGGDPLPNIPFDRPARVDPLGRFDNDGNRIGLSDKFMSGF